jgi:pimeloyl-ACP methyl ester carboxylesterase
VATRVSVSRLILLAPMIPRPGETAGEWWGKTGHADAIVEVLAPGDGMFVEPWPLDAWPEVPTRVLVPRGDRLFPRDFQRRVARERLGLEIDEMAGGHLPMLSRPRELAERLVKLAVSE